MMMMNLTLALCFNLGTFCGKLGLGSKVHWDLDYILY